MLSPSTRLSFTTLLLLFQLGYFLYELHWARSHRKQYSWEWGRFHFVALAMAVLGAVIGLTVWSHLEASDKNMNLACAVGMNDDAGGRGIRITSWVMIMLNFVLAYCGLFYNGLVLGMAIGFGLNFAQVYFALALLLQSRRAGPYPADIAVGIMILDALNAASTTQLSMKRLLVHPVWTVVSLIGQAVGLMAIGLLLHFFMLGHYEVHNPDFYQCSCIRFFWWAWMDSCCAQAPMEKATLWTYYIFRWVMFAHAACFALRYTLDFRACRKLEPVQKYVVEQGIVPSGLNANFWKEMEIMGQASERPRATPQRREQQQHINELLDDAGRGTSHERSLSRPVRLADLMRWTQFQYWTNRRSTLTLNFVMNTIIAVSSMFAAEFLYRDFHPMERNVLSDWSSEASFMIPAMASIFGFIELAFWAAKLYDRRLEKINRAEPDDGFRALCRRIADWLDESISKRSQNMNIENINAEDEHSPDGTLQGE